ARAFERFRRQREAGAAPESAPPAAPAPARALTARGAETIDALFGPLPATETTGRFWIYSGRQLRPVRARLGVSDGTYTELIEPALTEGTEVVTNILLGTEQPPRPTGGGVGNPLMPRRPGPPGGPGQRR
ncbi:MAG TPA: hypothetical protein VNI83_08775, partial [Vicinamibacterales bacterium]|nr:hypothetical protein [Vicinamibacterales bacterium]